MVLKGLEVAKKIEQDIIKELRHIDNFKLDAMIVGGDKASEAYLNAKVKLCKELGIDLRVTKLSETISEEELLAHIEEINSSDTSGFILENPLPKKFHLERVLSHIDPKIDMDCLTPYNQGRLFAGHEIISPATPKAVEQLMDYYDIEVEGKNVVILGRSVVVGRPIFVLMLNKNASVTILHSRSKNIEHVLKEADIVISAIGKAKYIKKHMVNKHSILIDVGINVIDGKLYGDVDYDNLVDYVDKITPVPGGVGVITNRILIMNAITLYKMRRMYENGCKDSK